MEDIMAKKVDADKINETDTSVSPADIPFNEDEFSKEFKKFAKVFSKTDPLDEIIKYVDSVLNIPPDDLNTLKRRKK
jgi:hypothetical protein